MTLPRLRIGRSLDAGAAGLPLVGTLDEIRLTVGARRDLSVSQSAVWPSSGEVDSDQSDNGWVDIIASRAGYSDIIKRFSITRVRRGQQGAAGYNTALVYAYQRGSSAPTLPNAVVTYYFATGVATGLNNGWTTAIPAGTDQLYVTVASASSNTDTDTIAATEWAAAVVISSSGTAGANGINSATVYLFLRTATSTPPAVPTATVTYTFSNGIASSLSGGWTQSLPTTGGAYRWIITGSALSTSPTDTILTGEWATPAILAQDGPNGADAIAASLSVSTVALPADSSGNVSSFAGAVTTIQVMKGATDDTSNWTISRIDSSGVTSSLSSATVTVSALTADTGYVDLIATRSTYATQTVRLSLTKVRSAVGLAGVVTALYLDSSAAGAAPRHAGVKFQNDGTLQVKDNSGTYQSAGNWYSPTTSGIGSSYWIKMTLTSTDTFSSGTTGASWQPLTNGLAWLADIASGANVRNCTASYVISISSTGTPLVAAGSISVTADTT